jgi:phosphoglucomutase/phosphomannomutase
MISAEEAAARLAAAEKAGQVCGAAAASIRRWLVEAPFQKYRAWLTDDIERGSWAELDDAFYKVLEFGTGGRRGKMYPVGTNVLNERTMAESARGLADYVTAKVGPRAARSCVIAHDTRHHSAEFAELCARVLAAAGFRVVLFRGHRSTPLLSFAVRHLRCDAGIMITASHNPPSDNGFKCYSSTGGQVIPPDDRGIIECVKAASDREIPETSLTDGLADGSIAWAGPELDEAYIASVIGESVSHARGLSLVYTPLHGVGETSVAACTCSNRSARPTVTFRPSRAMSPIPSIPGRSRPPSRRPGAEGPTSSWRATRTPTASASPCRPRAILAASGRPSTATRSASCSPRS